MNRFGHSALEVMGHFIPTGAHARAHSPQSILMTQPTSHLSTQGDHSALEAMGKSVFEYVLGAPAPGSFVRTLRFTQVGWFVCLCMCMFVACAASCTMGRGTAVMRICVCVHSLVLSVALLICDHPHYIPCCTPATLEPPRHM